MNFEKLISLFKTTLEAANLNHCTIERHTKNLFSLSCYCNEHGVKEVTEISRETIDNYQKHLLDLENKNKLSLDQRLRHMATVKKFFGYLVSKNIILFDPTIFVELPKMPRFLPRNTLNKKESLRLLSIVDLTTNARELRLNIRDQAILELFYATGIRCGEMRRLKKKDIDFDGLKIAINETKGLKDRVIPVSQRALDSIKDYIGIRKQLIKDHTPDILFISKRGNQLSEPTLVKLADKYLKRAGIKKRGGIRLFRHTIATNLLEAGMDIRYIQELLGHNQLSTTQIYTKVNIQKLKEIHKKTHPMG